MDYRKRKKYRVNQRQREVTKERETKIAKNKE